MLEVRSTFNKGLRGQSYCPCSVLKYLQCSAAADLRLLQGLTVVVKRSHIIVCRILGGYVVFFFLIFIPMTSTEQQETDLKIKFTTNVSSSMNGDPKLLVFI